MTNLTGQTINRYQIISQLGEGGMAVVYKAWDTRLERDVAVKLIRVDVFPPAALQATLQRFEREAKALARISHPNIVHLYDYGDHEGAPYLIMEYLAGGSLHQQSGERFPYQQAASIIKPIAQALVYAHSENIIHRDVKPSNILFTNRNVPKLSDFGIAKMFGNDESTVLTGTGMSLGTPAYMAPEQWAGEASPASDVYALGVVFYELLTGKPPYEADTPGSLFAKVLTQPLPNVRQIVPDLPDRVVNSINKALAKNPQERFSTMAEFAEILEQITTRGAISISPKQAELTETVQAIPSQSSEKLTRQVTIQTEATTTGESSERRKRAIRITRWAAIAAVIIGLAWIIFSSVNGKLWWKKVAISTATTSVSLIQEVKQATITPKPLIVQSSPTTTLTKVQSTYTITTQPGLRATETQVVTLTIGIGSTRVSPIDGMIQVYVPEGKFYMGCDPEDKGNASRDLCSNFPLEEVFLDSYWIDQTEITNFMYNLCVQEESCRLPIYISSQIATDYYYNPDFGNYPVIWISWDDAASYCTWVGRHLPTMEEWLKAARGAIDTRPYPWGSSEPDCNLANSIGCISDTNEVGSYPLGASPYNALDMIGNVGEWVDEKMIFFTSFQDDIPLFLVSGPMPSYDRFKLIGFRCASSP